MIAASISISGKF